MCVVWCDGWGLGMVGWALGGGGGSAWMAGRLGMVLVLGWLAGGGWG